MHEFELTDKDLKIMLINVLDKIDKMENFTRDLESIIQSGAMMSPR